MANSNLNNARIAKNDEFYTDLNDVLREMYAYVDHNPDLFRGKTVLLPCDDPEWSAFTSFFVQKFDELGLFKLISTSYAKDGGRGKVFTLKRDLRRKQTRIDDLEWSYLDGDGDFRSAEVTALRDESDFVITNPPFSLFRKFLEWIREGGQQFSIVGTISAVSYKTVFPLIHSGEMWLGYGFKNGNAYFKTPKAGDYGDGVLMPDGRVKFRNCVWFTSIEFGQRHEPLDGADMAMVRKLYGRKQAAANLGKRYDNYDAIEIPLAKAIPTDYDGIMGLPTSYLQRHCPEQFEIVGITENGEDSPVGPLRVPGQPKYDRPYIDGQRKQPRVFIRAIR
jgi:hypothetical protein